MSRIAEAFLPEFGGSTYEPKRDGVRLSRQLSRVRGLMLDGKWRTLREIADATGSPEASCSARLRDLRRNEFGGHQVDREPVPYQPGLYQYRVRT
jgi:hypothetical protein